MENRSGLTLGSLFDGSGGFPLGGILNDITPLWASEIEPFPIRVTQTRLPFMKHYGDVSKLNGGEIEPVDIITFGSPCQDMSVAGRRAGLDGSRSNLFYEAIRIVKEMRCATGGAKPRYIVWENVPGAFSSNKGQDFRSVLQAVCSVKDPDPVIPEPPKGRWAYAGGIVGDGYSVAWRTLDAQFWGVPQRRKRIYLVADFAAASAEQVLFEFEGLSGYSPQSLSSWKGLAGCASDGTGETGGICLNDQGGERMDITSEVTTTLRAESHHPPCVVGTKLEVAVPVENHPTDSRVKLAEDGKVQALTCRMGTGGGNVPLLLKIRAGCEGGGKGALIQEDKSATLSCNNDQTLFIPFGIGSFASKGMCSANPHAGYYETETSKTLDGRGGDPSCQQGGLAIVEEERPDTYAMTVGGYAQINREQCPTLMARDFKDPPVVNRPTYAVRRLTPSECARLQGFPDWWCADLGIENPTEEDIAYWAGVFETYRQVMGNAKKPKSRNQIVKWLKEPYTDAAEYKMWGNGVALPCVCFVLAGIVWSTQLGY